jgi:four helix bundle protein
LPIFDCRLPIEDCHLTSQQLKARTKAFAVRLFKVVDALPRSVAGQTVGRQLIRSATSVGANYRAACRAQSRADFAAKLSIVVEESDETLYWLELIQETGMVKAELLRDIISEANELVAIMLASRKTVKATLRSVNRKSAIENRQFDSERFS